MSEESAGPPAMRASDADRDAVVATLQQAMADGRLAPEEFQTRLDAALVARTLADLEPLTHDLPVLRPPPPTPAPPPRGGALASRFPRAVWGSWLTATLVCTVVYLLTDPGGYFWPAWVAGPWGAVLLARGLIGPGGPKERPGRRDDERDHL